MTGAALASAAAIVADTNTYYPGVSDIFVAGASGVLYYLVDNAAESFVPGFDLDNYYFEIGAPSVPYVASGELFGTDSPIFQAAQAVFYYGVPNVINSIVASAAALVPSFNIGPVKLGAGYLAGLYFYGATPDYDPDTGTGFAYSTNGLSAILAYVSTSISDSLPSAAALPSLSGAASAAAAAVETVVKTVEDAVNPTASSSAAAKTVSAASTEKKTEVAEDTTESTDSSTTTDSTSSTEDTSTESTSTGVASSAKPATTTAPKLAKPQNPLAKLGKRISDALGVTKKAKSESSSSSDSSSSSTGGSAK
jgi:hypothetical protein